MLNDSDIIERLKAGDREVLNVIYKEYRTTFIQWARTQYKLEMAAAVEIFQSSVVILYENVVSGKLTTLESSLKTYLFAIGKNKAREAGRNSYRFEELSYPHLKDTYEDQGYDDIQDERLGLVAEKLQELGEPCRQLLNLFYFERKNMDDIAEVMDYKNADTAKNLKYKCLQRLKKLVLNKPGVS